MQTPSRPVSWAWALAANAPTSSCRTPTHSMRSSRRIASVTGFSASPTTPHTWVTPCSARASMRSSATVVTRSPFVGWSLEPSGRASTQSRWPDAIGEDAGHDDVPRSVRQDGAQAGVAVPAAPHPRIHRGAMRLEGRRRGLAGCRFHAGLRVGADLRRRLPPLRQGRVGEGPAAVRRLLPRGGAQAGRAAGGGPRPSPAVVARRRLGGAGSGVRRRPEPEAALAPRRSRPLSRRDRRRCPDL